MLLRAEDGVALVGYRIPPVGPRRGGCLLVHGFGGSSREPAVIRLAEALAERGFEVLAYDARGHGGSGGRSTIMEREAADLVVAASALEGPFVAVGVSMGAIAVVRLAAENPPAGLAGVVTVSGPARWRLRPAIAVLAVLTRTRLGSVVVAARLGVRLEHRFRLPAAPVDLVGRICRPLAVVHGSADRLIRVDEAFLLHDRGGGPRRLDVVAGMGHGLSPQFSLVVVRAVEWALAAGGHPGGDASFGSDGPAPSR